ncbi:Protein of unknown function [Gryllus bimaculatus]|nr:Protein of unknown function [Gryllus bimaculatus]
MFKYTILLFLNTDSDVQNINIHFEETRIPVQLVSDLPIFYRKPYDLPLIAGRYEVYEDGAKEARRRECVKITRILNETAKELLNEGSYSVLQYSALIPHLEEREENNLIDDYKENLKNINLVRETIKDFRAVSRAKSETHHSQRCRVKNIIEKIDMFDQRHEKDKEDVELISEGLKLEIKSTEYLKDYAQHAYQDALKPNGCAGLIYKDPSRSVEDIGHCCCC